MAVGRPILAFGPRQSHVGEIVAQGTGWQLEHGDVDGAVAALRVIAELPAEALEAIGSRAQTLLRERFDSRSSRARVCDIIEGRRLVDGSRRSSCGNRSRAWSASTRSAR
jgi:hypothetical protein